MRGRTGWCRSRRAQLPRTAVIRARARTRLSLPLAAPTSTSTANERTAYHMTKTRENGRIVSIMARAGERTRRGRSANERRRASLRLGSYHSLQRCPVAEGLVPARMGSVLVTQKKTRSVYSSCTPLRPSDRVIGQASWVHSERKSIPSSSIRCVPLSVLTLPLVTQAAGCYVRTGRNRAAQWLHRR